ncbi:glycosyltransferase family 9 protein [Flexistipes sp.]|uniref:glycosyltransferase family 9 protein n=1 Tax=Flexistipes sp. TaxID=3088135 RepID=UPI002E1B3B59|nr:glycosyltransferase family 9 protein [Flexistipes sp.]
MKILLIQLRRIGDVMMCTPAVRSVRKAYPDAVIHFLTEPPADQILQYNPHIDKLITFKKNKSTFEKIKMILRLRNEKYDMVIDFHSNPTTGWFSLLSGSKKRIGEYHKARRFLYTKTAKPGKYKYAGYAKFSFLETVCITPDFGKIEFFISEKERVAASNLLSTLGAQKNDRLITVSPVSRQPYKVWPLDRFAKVCDYIIEKHNAKILFIYGPGEEHFVEDVKSMMNNDTLPLYPPISLAETRAVFEKAVMHIGNDNGPMHIAISSGIPTVAVFGKPSAAGWTPPNSNINIGIDHDPGCKKNCVYPECGLECLKSIKTERVISEINNIIRREALL